MNLRTYLLLPGLVTAAIFAPQVAQAVVAHADAEKQFIEARIAYDEGRFADAVGLYEDLLAHGLAASRLYFNMGNALVRTGRLGEAVLSYRRALYLRPRDPDAAANLRFTQNITQALSPEEPAWSRLLGRMSLEEWLCLAVAAYWLGAACMALYRLRSDSPRWALQAAALMGMLLLTCAAGALRWHEHARHPEVVIVKRDVQSLFAPVEGSQPHFKLPEGSLVRQVERRGSWLRVSSGTSDGWIPDDTARAVLPLR